MIERPENVALWLVIPKSLEKEIKAFVKARPEWDCDRLIEAAIALFLANQKISKENHDKN
jgi:asparagine synthetase B (glutamine-hydrolysing)